MPSRWNGSAELGAVITTGNTESANVNAQIDGSYRRDKWTHNFQVGALSVSQEGNQTAERYFSEYKVDYHFQPAKYVFAALRGERDEFSGYDYSVTETIGYGQRVWETEKIHLDLEAGVGGRQRELDDGDNQSEVVVRGGAAYEHSISETTGLTEDLLIESGNENTQAQSITALTTRISGDLSMKVSLTIRHNDNPPRTRENTDTVTAVSLLYNF